jgi:dipeptidyl aminopeptidase/acylaminoacyl peptidase
LHVTDSQTTILYPSSNPSKRRITAEDLWKIARVGAPHAAPDGSVVVPVTTYDLEANKGKPRLWLVPAGGSEPRALTSDEHASADPALSPDGRWVSFVRARGEEKAQLHVMRLDGGEAERLTDLPLGAVDPKWFPDGKRIAFVTMLLDEAPTPEGTKELLEKRAKDPVKVQITEDRVYRYWDHWLLDGERPHLFVLELDTRRLTDLTPAGTGWFDLMDPCGQYDIAPDGLEIVFAANSSLPPHDPLRWAVYTVPTNGKGPVQCLTPEGTPPKSADCWRPRYSPDGGSIVYGLQRDPFFYADKIRMVRFDRKAGTHTVLTEGWDRSPAAWEFGPDGTLILEAEDRGRVLLFALGAAGGTPKRLIDSGTVSGLRIGRDGRIYFTAQSLSSPPEAASCRMDGGDVRKLTRFNDALMSFPALILAVVIVGLLGPSLSNAMTGIGLLAILASGLNPTYFNVIPGLFAYQHSALQRSLKEWHAPALWPPSWYSCLLVGAAAVLLWAWRRSRLSDILLFAVFATLSLMAQRNVIFIGLIAPIAIASYLP